MGVSNTVLAIKNALIAQQMALKTASSSKICQSSVARGFATASKSSASPSIFSAVSSSKATQWVKSGVAIASQSTGASASYSAPNATALLQTILDGTQRTSSAQTWQSMSNVELFRRANPELALAIQQASPSAWNESNIAYATDAQKSQLETNLAQVRQFAEQTGMDAWSVESLAHDLAVFGLDLTSLSAGPDKLLQTVRDKSNELVAELESTFTGTKQEFDAARRRITGASSRLVNGLQSQSSRVAASVSSSVKVEIDGVNVNAGYVIAVGNVVVDPLVLDLNGDGINLKGYEDGVEFDMDGDGEAANMGFIRGDDAFLFVDEYGDGVVRDGKQLFGNADGYANGFEKLASYDDNGDGVIDQNDAVWDKLRVWVETTEDGVCESGETMSLDEAGISSIAVGYQNVREDDGNGNLIGQVGEFTRADGTSGLAADVWLQEGEKAAAGEAPAAESVPAPAEQASMLRELMQLDPYAAAKQINTF